MWSYVRDARSHAFIALALNHLGYNFDSRKSTNNKHQFPAEFIKTTWAAHSLYYPSTQRTLSAPLLPIKNESETFFLQSNIVYNVRWFWFGCCAYNHNSRRDNATCVRVVCMYIMCGKFGTYSVCRHIASLSSSCGAANLHISL